MVKSSFLLLNVFCRLMPGYEYSLEDSIILTFKVIFQCQKLPDFFFFEEYGIFSFEYNLLPKLTSNFYQAYNLFTKCIHFYFWENIFFFSKCLSKSECQILGWLRVDLSKSFELTKLFTSDEPEPNWTIFSSARLSLARDLFPPARKFSLLGLENHYISIPYFYSKVKNFANWQKKKSGKLKKEPSILSTILIHSIPIQEDRLLHPLQAASFLKDQTLGVFFCNSLDLCHDPCHVIKHE